MSIPFKNPSLRNHLVCAKYAHTTTVIKESLNTVRKNYDKDNLQDENLRKNKSIVDDRELEKIVKGKFSVKEKVGF